MSTQEKTLSKPAQAHTIQEIADIIEQTILPKLRELQLATHERVANILVASLRAGNPEINAAKFSTYNIEKKTATDIVNYIHGLLPSWVSLDKKMGTNRSPTLKAYIFGIKTEAESSEEKTKSKATETATDLEKQYKEQILLEGERVKIIRIPNPRAKCRENATAIEKFYSRCEDLIGEEAVTIPKKSKAYEFFRKKYIKNTSKTMHGKNKYILVIMTTGKRTGDVFEVPEMLVRAQKRAEENEF